MSLPHGTPLAPDVYRRIRDRGDRLREEMRQKFGGELDDAIGGARPDHRRNAGVRLRGGRRQHAPSIRISAIPAWTPKDFKRAAVLFKQRYPTKVALWEHFAPLAD